MNMKIWISLFLSMSLSLGVQASTTEAQGDSMPTERVDAVKQQADSAYMGGNYVLAARLYESLVQQGTSEDIYYNLGNSYYKKGDIARSILNYERALKLHPGAEDINANLEIARSKTVDKIEADPGVFFFSWLKSRGNVLQTETWGVVALVCFFLSIIAFVSFLFLPTIKWRNVGFVGCLAFLSLSIIANLFAWRQKTIMTQDEEAIIMASSIEVRSTPSESGTTLFVLHEGTKVLLLNDSMKEWVELRLEDGKVGWIPTSAVERI